MKKLTLLDVAEKLEKITIDMNSWDGREPVSVRMQFIKDIEKLATRIYKQDTK